MHQYIAHITLLVNDYDEAIRFYTETLNFTLVKDTRISDTKRWVRVAPANAGECCLLLAQADKPEQERAIGNQTGVRVFLY